MRIANCIRIVLCAAAVLPAAAQPGMETSKSREFPFTFGPLGLGMMKRDVGLSDDTMRQIEGIMQSSRHLLVDLRADLEKREGDLQEALNSPQMSPAQVEKAVDTLIEARGRLSKATTMMMVRMRQLLTHEQWRKLAELQQRPKPVLAPAPPAPPGPPALAAPRPSPAPQPPPRPPEEQELAEKQFHSPQRRRVRRENPLFWASASSASRR